MAQKKLRFEDFKPKVKKGQILGSGAKIIFETQHPFNQIALPVELADLIVLCNGEYSIREIIDRIYRHRGSVHFRNLFNTIFRLRDRGFLENGHDLDDISYMHTEFKSLQASIKPYLQFSLGRKIFNDSVYPLHFYFFSMLLLVGSIIGLSDFPTYGFEKNLLLFSGSYINGFLVFFVCMSVLLSLKNFFKLMMLMFLTGRAYNVRLICSPVAIFLKVGDESVHLVSNSVYLTLYHFSLTLCYFAFVSLMPLFDATLPYHSIAIVAASILALYDMNPFRPSEATNYFKTLFDDDSIHQIAHYLKNQSLLSAIDPKDRDRDKSVYFAFSHFALLWSLLSLYFYAELIRANQFRLFQTIEKAEVSEGITALIILVSLTAMSLLVGLHMGQIVMAQLRAPIRKFKSFFVSLLHRDSVSSWSVLEVVRAVEDLPLFSYLSESLLQKVIEASQVKAVRAGQRIITEGEIGKHLYVLLDGRLSVQKHFPGTGLTRMASIRPVAIFGEIAVLETSRRKADVVALEKSVVLQVPAEVLRKSAINSQYIRKIESFTNMIMVNQFFASAPMFCTLPEEVIHTFTTRGKIESFDAGQTVFQQGSYGDSFYLVLRGSVGVVIHGQRIKRIKQGGFFGEIAVIADIPRVATIVADEPVLLLRIHRDTFWEILVNHIEIAMFIESVGERRIREDIEILGRFEADTEVG